MTQPALDVEDGTPRRGNRLSAALGRLALGLLGWRIEGLLPSVPRAVLIVAPHTSNWEFLIGLAAMFAIRLRACWLGKASLFRFPFRRLLRWLGGIPVNRMTTEGVVEAAVARLGRTPDVYLCLSPEGTRKKVARWKTGFYRIARGAGVPIFLVSFDYQARVVRLGPLFEPTGDYEADLRVIQSRFSASMARHPAAY